MKTANWAVPIVLAIAGATVPTAAQAAPPPAWTHAGYGPGNTGYNPAEATINATTIRSLRLKWRAVPRAGTEGCESQTVPVVADGRMFMVDGDGVGAFDLRTGRRLWADTTIMDADVHRTMTVAGNLVITSGYSCYGMSDPSGHLVALDAATGKVRWRNTEGSATDQIVADGGMIISYSKCEVCSSRSVTGYRAADGNRVWGVEAALAVPVSAGRRLLLTEAEGGSFAVAAATGAVLWRSPVPWAVLAASPAGDRFYAAGPAGQLAALDAATGKVLWSVAAGAGLLATDGSRVYVAQEDRLTAYDVRAGRKLWQRAGAPGGRPVRAGGLLYLPGAIVSPVNGKTVLTAGYGSYLHPAVVVGGRVLRVEGREVRAYAPGAGM